MRKLSTTGYATADAIGRRESFTTHGALRATADRQYFFGYGRLVGADRDRFSADAPNIVYTVFSYGTPIGWVTADGTAYRVAQRFSVTTSRHQGQLYRLA